jgi:hypothetical protein
MPAFTGLGSELTNTPIVPFLYNSRGLITHKTGNQNCFRADNGDLWCVVNEPAGNLMTYESYDNGFSWYQHAADPGTTSSVNTVSGLECNGPHANVIINPKWGRIQYLFPDNALTVIQGVSIPLTDFEEGLTDSVYTTTNFTAVNTALAEEQYFRACNNENTGWLFYRSTTDKVTLKRVSPRDNTLGSAGAMTGSDPCLNTFGLAATIDSRVHCLFAKLDTSYRVKFVTYDDRTVTITSIKEILDTGSSTIVPNHLNVAYDGYGSLCAVYCTSDSNSNVITYYAISTDDGVTWSNTVLPLSSGHSSYVDAIKATGTSRPEILGGSNGGFIMAYVNKSPNGTPRTYVRQITTTDGSSYSLGEEKEIATHIDSTTAVVGLHFFQPMNAKLLDLSDPGLVRIAYQIGEGNSDTQVDGRHVIIGQTLLANDAFPSAIDSDTNTYIIDTGLSNSLLVTASIVGSPSTNQDWYAIGKTGEYTTRYLDAFDRLGTSIRLLKYEPDEDGYLGDRTTYTSPVESGVLVIFEPMSYSFPTPDLSVDGQTAYVEQDIRRIYLPPDFFLSRSFIINAGGHLKRTVWLAQFAGNEYELSQVVPYFFNNQICYYRANAYVVGPSRDPFSRTILPSET